MEISGSDSRKVSQMQFVRRFVSVTCSERHNSRFLQVLLLEIYPAISSLSSFPSLVLVIIDCFGMNCSTSKNHWA